MPPLALGIVIADPRRRRMDLGAELDVIAGRDESLLADARRDQASIGPLTEESKDQERSGADGTGRCRVRERPEDTHRAMWISRARETSTEL